MRRSISLLLAFTFTVCTFSSCQFANTHDAVKFNDVMVKINQTIVANATEWSDTLLSCNKTGQYTHLTKVRQKMVEYIQSQIEEVSKMDAIGKGGEKFRKEELVFLKVEKQVLGEGLQPYEELTNESTIDQVQAAQDNLNKELAKEEKSLATLQQVQQQYATDNNFRLEHKNMLNK